MKRLKQILSNKNTVTFIGIILGVLVLYFFYTWRLNQETGLVSIPYANQQIGPRTKIEESMISYYEVPQASIKGDVLTVKSQILGKYTNINITIPNQSMFYKEYLVSKEELPDSFIEELEEGQVPYNYTVTVKSTYGNSMYPGNYVDIYFKGKDGNILMFGKLIENVKVLAVKDSSGNHVFESNDRVPNQIIFGVTNEIHHLLRAVEEISSAEIVLVPANTKPTEEGSEIKINVTSARIKEYIESQVTFEDDFLSDDVVE